MLSHCPVCGARQPGAESCRRCGSGLGLLRHIARRGQELERQAVAALGSGNREQAREHLRQAMALHATPLARALLDFADHDAAQPCQDPRGAN